MDEDITVEFETEDANSNDHFKSLKLDIEYYQSFLDDVDIPDDKKQEFIETMWEIMVQFVDMGFGIEPTQMALQENQTSISKLAIPLLDISNADNAELAANFGTAAKLEDKQVKIELEENTA